MLRRLRLWFTFDERVDQREYVMSGLALAALKYAIDASLVYVANGRIWTPIDYATSVNAVFRSDITAQPRWLAPTLAALALPFMWIGFTMTLRRALDAGRNAWIGLLFLVPFVNYLVIAWLAAAPPVVATRRRVPVPRPREHLLPSALLSIVAGVAIALAMLAVTVLWFEAYGVALFLSTPFVMGAVTAFLFNRRYPATNDETIEIVAMMVAVTAGVAVMTAVEGLMCLWIVGPLALLVAILGGIAGRYIALHDASHGAHAVVALLITPALAVVDARQPATALREVRSTVEIDASPDVVWRHVIDFPPLDERPELLFRLGIAYPISAEIDGVGVGAVRRCVFSTGAFVEPITVWDPGRRLAFDVTSQPAPLQEWSPYANVVPPHLDGYFQSRRGEFRLVPIAGGKTRLEGSTWYEMRLYPAGYWVLFADAFIGRIHERVLRHIRSLSESDALTRRPDRR